jgi:hypothetical protein
MHKKAKTQKAKGVLNGLDALFSLELRDKYYGINRFITHSKHALICSESDIKNNSVLPCFARPCPKVPRHGFVDSKLIYNNEQLLDMWNKSRAIDSEAEIILGPYVVPIKYNAVYINSGNISIGEGNDGATNGNNSISFPVAPYKFEPLIMEKSGLDQDDTVYLESIYRPRHPNTRKWLLTQIRGGPKVNSASSDFIPKRIKVKEIVKPHNDLVKWEKDVTQFKHGTVVYGAGHTLASHAAIHCVINKIPFITSKCPKIGDILKPKSSTRNKLVRDDFRRGVKAAINLCNWYKFEDLCKFLYYSLSIIHNWVYIKQSPHASWLLGAASMLYCKIGASLVFGEHRHLEGSSENREKIYEHVMYGKLKLMKDLPRMFNDFYNKKWSSGFGGIPWATCAWYMHSLWNEITKVLCGNSATVRGREVASIIGVMNRATNIAHNNGWWFNKFASKEDMNFIANVPGLAAYLVVDVFYNLHKRVKALKSSKLSITHPKRIVAPCGVSKNGKLAWVYINGVDYSRTVKVKLKFEDGTRFYKYLTLTKDEYDNLLRRYKKEGKRCRSDLLCINVRNGGKFKFQGGDDRNLEKVFGL